MNDAAWVEWMTCVMGGVPRQAYAAAFPPDRFYCLLDDLPLQLLPQRTGHRRERAQLGAMQVSQGCVLRGAEDIPPEFDAFRDLLSGFALQGTMAWVHDEISGSSLPFWLGPQSQSVLEAIANGEPVEPGHSQVMRFLEGAGLLVIAAESAEPRMRRETEIANATAMFRDRGYAPISNLIHPFHIAALRRYYRYQIRSGAIYLGDKQSPRRYVAHNEPVARFFHHQICGALSKIVGQPLKPSYVYFASYLSGAELKKHTDREQCEFSLTLCLDFAPEPQNTTPWPIKLDTPNGTVTVYQGIGDALAYRGTRLPHYRDPLGVGQTSTSMFFHYVPVDFPGPLD